MFSFFYFYDIIVFMPRDGRELNDKEIYFGPCHLIEKSPLMIAYYQNVLDTKKKIVGNLNSSNPKYQILIDEIDKITTMLQS